MGVECGWKDGHAHFYINSWSGEGMVDRLFRDKEEEERAYAQELMSVLVGPAPPILQASTKVGEIYRMWRRRKQ